MALLRLQEISLSFGGPALLDGVNFAIDKQERVCLIGRNGEGKSTLLNVILGKYKADSGERILQRNTVIAQLEQDIPTGLNAQVYDVIASGLSELGEAISEYHKLSQQTDNHDDAWLKLLERAQKNLEDMDGWQFQQQIETVISRLSLPADDLFSDLSGGMKRRVLLARALVQQPDILLLDEPTNHLDIEAIIWLEAFLKEFKGSILFITHDRAFLRALATRIIELDRGVITNFPGDYDTYLTRKQELLDSESSERARFDKRLAQEEVWIRQGIKARRTRNEGRVRALEKMRNEFKQRRMRQGTAKISLDTAEASGKLVVEAENIRFSYPDSSQALINDFSTTIQRGDKIGVIGPNGVGKSTLLNILLGKLEPTSGKLKLGTNREVAYFDQLRGQLDLNKSVRDNLEQGSEQLVINGKPRHVISYLQDFLFSPERTHSPVSTLSGGERNRLLLAKLFIKPANILVLDEPTNDLDIETLELLEELLLDFSGTLLLVSHDRNFLNNVITSSIVFEGNGVVEEYVGGYDDWLLQRSHNPAVKDSPTKSNSKPSSPATSAPAKSQTKPVKKKLSYKDQKALDELPQKIENLETTIQSLHDAMSSPEFYKQSADDIAQAQNALASHEAELEAAYELWQQLEA